MVARFWVGGTGTWDTTDTTHWASASNGAGGQSVPTSADTVTFDANSGGGGTGVCTINGDHSISTLTCGLWPGTLDWSVNNNNFTCSGLINNNGAANRVMKLGSGTLNCGGWLYNPGASSSTFTSTGMVIVNAPTGTSDISLIHAGTTPLPNVTIGPCNFWPGYSVSSNSSFTNMYMIGPARLRPTAAIVITVTNLIMTNTKGKPIDIRSNGSTVGQLSIASGTVEFNWAALRGITFTGGATFRARNSFDFGLNTGITISPPRAGLIIGG